jgi:hypothetical protein
MALTDGATGGEMGRPSRIVRVRVGRLRRGDSPRLGGIDTAHLDALVELDGAWPPLLVTPSMRILDGHYRHLAARRIGMREVECTIFEGDDTSGYVESVRRNSVHGLPLTLAERRAAATRVLLLEPAWSDRRIGHICGLAHETVGRIRRGLSADGTISLHEKRLGRDGALRSLPRRDAGTAPPVGDRVEVIPLPTVGERPEPAIGPGSQRRGTPRGAPRGPDVVGVVTGAPAAPAALTALSTDPAFTSTDAGTGFVGWFDGTSLGDGWSGHVDAVPLSRVYEVADEARRRASAWNEFADSLVARAGRDGRGRR